MNKLPLPEIDDAALLNELAGNEKLSSHPHLAAHVADILGAYENYVQAQGVATGINALALPAALVTALKTHFEQPPTALTFIETERRANAHRNCPLCGSLHSGTVDHVIPRTPHPAFSIFSRNLVRACKCNSSKNAAMTGPNPGQRILHPYFDDCLAQRLLRANFRQHGPVPKVTLEILVEAHDPMYAAVEYHVDRIVERTAVKNFLVDRWDKFCRKPTTLVPMLRTPIVTMEQLAGVLDDQCRVTDEVHESLNNWDSMFVSGLGEEQTLEWLFGRLSAPGYLPGSALEWN